MTIRNKTLFNEIADIMEFKPEQYNQGTWGTYRPSREQYEKFEKMFGYRAEEENDYNWTKVEECGTALCLAGHAAALTGWFLTKGDLYEGKEMLSWTTVSQQRGATWVSGRNISEVGQEALGITEEEATRLFAGGQEWTADEIRAFGRGEPILKHLDESDVRDDEV